MKFEEQVNKLYSEQLLTENVRSLAKKAWMLANTMPYVAGASADVAGAPKWLGRVAKAFAILGDWVVPGLPAGSAIVFLSILPFKPSAPIGGIRKAISEFLERENVEEAKGERSIMKALRGIRDYAKFFSVLAVMMEGRKFSEALRLTRKFMKSEHARKV